MSSPEDKKPKARSPQPGSSSSIGDEETLTAAIFEAASKGHDPDIRRCLSSGVSPNAVLQNITGPLPQPGWTPLHMAAACAQLMSCKTLLNIAADPNIQDEAGRTPLDVTGFASYYNYFNKKVKASESSLVGIIQMLIKAGGTYNTMKEGGLMNVDSPLDTAVYLESIAMFKMLLDVGASPSCLNQAGLTPLHVCVYKELAEFLQLSCAYGPIDVRDKDGRTVLRAAVDAGWLAGVRIALEAEADITARADDGDSPFHAAAASGNLDILHEIINIAKEREEIDCRNEKGETPLFKAITSENMFCVNLMLNEGANMKVTLPGDINVLHVAADNDLENILGLLLEHDDAKELINIRTVEDKDNELYGFAPIHMAATNKQSGCVQKLMEKGANIKLQATGLDISPTPLHIAAIINNIDTVDAILKFDYSTLNEMDGKGKLPLHVACRRSNREVIKFLLKKGANLAAYTNEKEGKEIIRRTAFDIIMNNVLKPTEFVKETFDSYISSDGKDLQDNTCCVTVDYSVLIPPESETAQLNVVEALVKTGNRFDQRSLLVHPLVESFLYLKWKALLPFFYGIIFIHSLFLVSFTVLVSSSFYYFDTKDCLPAFFNTGVWCLFSVLFLGVKFFQDFHLSIGHSVKHVETLIKVGAVVFASLTLLVMPWSLHGEGTRWFATIALLLAWLDMLCLISRFPTWGYYVLMFGKVSLNVVKILVTFLFLIMGFSLSFMILCRVGIPFDGPWPAVVKTIVMMTSEFDYGNIFDEEHSKELASSLILLRLIFLVFLIVAAIALMNLITGVAVNNISELEDYGNIKRLTKQVEFIGTFDTLGQNKIFSTILPSKIYETFKTKQVVSQVMSFRPRKSKIKEKLPSKLIDNICNIAQKVQKETEEDNEMKLLKKKLDDMHETMIKTKPPSDASSILEEDVEKETAIEILGNQFEMITTHLTRLEEFVKEIKTDTNYYKKESKAALDTVKLKIDQSSEEIVMFIRMLIGEVHRRRRSE